MTDRGRVTLHQVVHDILQVSKSVIACQWKQNKVNVVLESEKLFLSRFYHRHMLLSARRQTDVAVDVVCASTKPNPHRVTHAPVNTSDEMLEDAAAYKFKEVLKCVMQTDAQDLITNRSKKL